MSNKKKEIRNNFRRSVLKRDGYRCRCCGIAGKDRQGGDEHRQFHKTDDLPPLDAHHIQNRTSDNYVKDNGISVCDGCHLKAEKYHITGGADFEPGFHPNDLYEKIGSSWRI